MRNNIKKLNKLNQQLQHCFMLFVSSNSGTGKSTFFKWLLIRKAVKGLIKVDFYFRYENELELKFSNDAFLKPPLHASKRLLKLCNKVEIIKEDNNYFLTNKETGEKIGQALAINIQGKYKSTENAIYSDYAMFDEVMPDNNQYCKLECYNFSRLIDTRARNRDYRVICLYNNTQPYFPYKEYFKNTGARFIDFVGVKYEDNETFNGIQSILRNSGYGDIYTNNQYQFYKEFYKDINIKKHNTLFYINIQGRLFALKEVGEYFIIVNAKKTKKNKEILALSMEDNEFAIIDRTNGIVQFLTLALNRRLVFANRKQNTIFVKTLADELNLSYNI